MSEKSIETQSQFQKEAGELIGQLSLLQEWASNRCYGSRTTERAFIIEFAGMPKAGKSSAIETIRHFFSHGTKKIIAKPVEYAAKYKEGYSVHTPAEGVSLRTPNFLKPNLWDFNAWAGAYAVQELLQARHDRYHDLVLLDRGPWDAGCWLEYVRKFRKEDVHIPSDADSIVNFFQLPHWATFSDLHVLLTVDPQDAQKRERDQRLIEHGGFASNLSGMGRMKDIYIQQFVALKKAKESECGSIKAPTAIHIDTTRKDPKGVALEIIRAALELLAEKVKSLPPKEAITEEEVRTLLKPMVESIARDGRVVEFNRYLPRFVEEANRLDGRNRQAIRDNLRYLSEKKLEAASDRKADEIVQALAEMLQDERSQ